jgi:hypothetical protein
MLSRAALVRTDVSEERIALIIRVTDESQPHGVTSQETEFFTEMYLYGIFHGSTVQHVTIGFCDEETLEAIYRTIRRHNPG